MEGEECTGSKIKRAMLIEEKKMVLKLDCIHQFPEQLKKIEAYLSEITLM